MSWPKEERRENPTMRELMARAVAVMENLDLRLTSHEKDDDENHKKMSSRVWKLEMAVLLFAGFAIGKWGLHLF